MIGAPAAMLVEQRFYRLAIEETGVRRAGRTPGFAREIVTQKSPVNQSASGI